MTARATLALALCCGSAALADGVRAQVVDEVGAGAGGVWVVLHPLGTPEEVLAGPLPNRLVTGPTAGASAASGLLVLENTPPGRYVAVAVEHSGSSFLVGRTARSEVEVPRDGEARFRLVLGGGASLRGRVLGPDGQPVAGATIGLAHAPTDAEADLLEKDEDRMLATAGLGRAQAEMIERARKLQRQAMRRMPELKSRESLERSARALPLATTGADGRFELRRLKPVTHAVFAFKQGYGQAELVQAKPPGEVELRVHRRGALVGTVLDEAGNQAGLFSVMKKGESSQSFQQGSFELPVDADGEWLLYIWGSDTIPVVRRATVAKDRVTTLPPVKLAAGRTLTVRLKGERPAKDGYCWGSMKLKGNEFDPQGRTVEGREKDGAVVFRALPEEAAEALVRCTGLTPVVLKVGPRDTQLEAQVGRGVTVWGKLVDERGRAWPSINVDFTQPQVGGASQSATTDPDGSFRVSGLVGGRAILQFSNGGSRPSTSGRRKYDSPIFPSAQALELPPSGEVRLDGRFAVAGEP